MKYNSILTGICFSAFSMSLQAANFYNCSTQDTIQLLKAGDSSSLLLRVDESEALLNDHSRIWNYLSSNTKVEGKVYYTSQEPSNFLQSTDLLAEIPDSATHFLNPVSDFKMALKKLSNNTQSTYDCKLQN